MKKILNFRPLFYSFLAFLTAILFAPYIFKTNWIYISIFILFLFVFLILSIFRQKIKYYLLILFFIVIGLTSYFIEASTYDVKAYNQDILVIGRVASEKQSSSSQKIVLDSVFIDGNIIKEKVYVSIYGESFLKSGDIITFSKKLKNIDAFYENGNFASFYYKNNIRYTVNVSQSNIEIIGSKLKLNDIIRSNVKEKLFKNMSSDNAAIAYATLLGDQSDIDMQTMNDYRGSGIAHILSISGLHISILVGVLFFILNKLKSPKILSFFIILIVLSIYCYICGFVPSVLRASIMNICFLLALIMGHKYDSLSAIGLAGIIMLVLSPFSAYDVGFQLSFGSIISIALFYKPIRDFFKQIRFPNFLASSLAISISVQFLILPILINAFGGTSIFTIFINIIVVPIFSLAYIILFIFTPLLFLSNFFGNFLWLSDVLFKCINICANFVVSIKWSIIPKIDLSLIGVLLFYMLIFISSRLIFIKTKYKLILNIIISFLIVLLIGLSQLTQIIL